MQVYSVENHNESSVDYSNKWSELIESKSGSWQEIDIEENVNNNKCVCDIGLKNNLNINDNNLQCFIDVKVNNRDIKDILSIESDVFSNSVGININKSHCICGSNCFLRRTRSVPNMSGKSFNLNLIYGSKPFSL